MEQGIFLTVKDLMKLNGSNNYNSCGNYLRNIRWVISAKKRKLTIKEYCDYEVIDFYYTWKFLRGVEHFKIDNDN